MPKKPLQHLAGVMAATSLALLVSLYGTGVDPTRSQQVNAAQLLTWAAPFLAAFGLFPLDARPGRLRRWEERLVDLVFLQASFAFLFGLWNYMAELHQPLVLTAVLSYFLAILFVVRFLGPLTLRQQREADPFAPTADSEDVKA